MVVHKYLVQSLPDVTGCRTIEVERGILSDKDVILSVKRVTKGAESEFTLVFQSDSELMKFSIPESVYHRLLAKSNGNIIRKKRIFISLPESMVGVSGTIAKVDMFFGALKGIHIAEVEFKDEAEAQEFKKPDWFGSDVSENNAYTTSAMMWRGIQPMSKERLIDKIIE